MGLIKWWSKFRFQRKIYKDYIKKVENIGSSPINKAEFLRVTKKCRQALVYLRYYKKISVPFIAVSIDKNFDLYGMIEVDKYVFNVWTKDQTKYLIKDKDLFKTNELKEE